MRSKAITLCVINVGDVRALLLAILATLVKSKGSDRGDNHARVGGDFQINPTAIVSRILEFEIGFLRGSVLAA